MPRRLLAMIVALSLWPALAVAAENVMRWTDNSNNEANFKIERVSVIDLAVCPTATSWAEIVVLGANVVTFTDSAVTEGQSYCYRVRASNAAGNSAYSNVAGRTVPPTLMIPAAPSGLTVGP